MRHTILPVKQDNRQPASVEDSVRQRLRSLRVARGWSLDQLATRSGIGASTISRLETGHRRLPLDQLVDLARALETTIDQIIGGDDEGDVVIRPTRAPNGNGAVYWPLNRRDDPSGRVVAKMRIPAANNQPTARVHPGRDWFYVLDGTARLVIGDREHLVQAGQAAEFDTMTPHSIAGHGAPVEILTIFDHHGEHAHLRPTPP